MQRPTWATVLGTLMILFGGCGVMNDVKQINTPALIDFQDDLMEELATEFGPGQLDQEDLEVLRSISPDSLTADIDTSMTTEDFTSLIKATTYLSPEVSQKLVKYGYWGLIVSVLYIITGILFFARRRHVLSIAVSILVLSLIFCVIQIIDYRSTNISQLMQIGLDLSLSVGGFIDVVLLVILAIVDKSYYKASDIQEDFYDRD